MNKLFSRFDRLAREAGVSRNTKASVEWFRRYIRKIGNIRSHEKVTEGLKTKNKVTPGEMVTYVYDAKYKDKLPYWDKFPLIVVLEFTKDGWYGLNLHYLPPTVRAKVLAELSVTRKNLMQIRSALEKDARLKVCLKRYLAKQAVTEMSIIPKSEWEIAIQLPFENFIGATAKKVWSQRK